MLIPHFSELATPLYTAAAKLEFVFGEVEMEAFIKLKTAMIGAPALRVPDHKRPFVLETDASALAAGACLKQYDDNGDWVPVAWHSRKFSKAEQNYSTFERELYAFVLACETFRVFLEGRRFLLRTDNSALVGFPRHKLGKSQRVDRWTARLQTFLYDIEKIPGKVNVIADGLSRAPEVFHEPANSELLVNSVGYFSDPESGDEEECPGESRVAPDKGKVWKFCVVDQERPRGEAGEESFDLFGGKSELDSSLFSFSENSFDFEGKASETFCFAESPFAMPLIPCDFNPLVIQPAAGVPPVSAQSHIQEVEPVEVEIGELRDAQQADFDIPEVIKVLNGKFVLLSEPEKENFRQKLGPLGKHLLEHVELLGLEDGLLVWRAEGSVRIVVAEKKRFSVLEYAHAGPGAAHAGVAETTRRVALSYYWPHWRHDAKMHVLACETCALFSQQRRGRAPLGYLQAFHRFDVVSIDIFGGGSTLPTSNFGNKYVLVCIDLFTKFVVAVPLPDQQAETVASAFLYKWILVMGPPLRLHSDQGRNFESELFSNLCRVWRIGKTRTSPYHPQGNGACERVNHTIISGLAKTVHGNSPGKWDLALVHVVFAYNASVHRSTNATPFSLVFGAEVLLPSEILVGLSKPPLPIHSFAYRQYLQLSSAFPSARDNLRASFLRSKDVYDAGAAKRLFRAGDKVCVRKVAMSGPSKLAEKWSGLHEVISVEGVIVQIRDLATGTIRFIHHDRLSNVSFIPRDPLVPRGDFRPDLREEIPEVSAQSNVGAASSSAGHVDLRPSNSLRDTQSQDYEYYTNSFCCVFDTCASSNTNMCVSNADNTYTLQKYMMRGVGGGTGGGEVGVPGQSSASTSGFGGFTSPSGSYICNFFASQGQGATAAVAPRVPVQVPRVCGSRYATPGFGDWLEAKLWEQGQQQIQKNGYCVLFVSPLWGTATPRWRDALKKALIGYVDLFGLSMDLAAVPTEQRPPRQGEGDLQAGVRRVQPLLVRRCRGFLNGGFLRVDGGGGSWGRAGSPGCGGGVWPGTSITRRPSGAHERRRTAGQLDRRLCGGDASCPVGHFSGKATGSSGYRDGLGRRKGVVPGRRTW
jgi:transposase InsO family protein